MWKRCPSDNKNFTSPVSRSLEECWSVQGHCSEVPGLGEQFVTHLLFSFHCFQFHMWRLNLQHSSMNCRWLKCWSPTIKWATLSLVSSDNLPQKNAGFEHRGSHVPQQFIVDPLYFVDKTMLKPKSLAINLASHLLDHTVQYLADARMVPDLHSCAREFVAESVTRTRA